MWAVYWAVTLMMYYQEMVQREPDVLFGGRLAEYKYYDMDKVIENALKLCRRELQ